MNLPPCGLTLFPMWKYFWGRSGIFIELPFAITVKAKRIFVTKATGGGCIT
jgi:hypothetical protein